jgi:hypothetical protein
MYQVLQPLNQEAGLAALLSEHLVRALLPALLRRSADPYLPLPLPLIRNRAPHVGRLAPL